jgi:hypothetical protein
MTTFTTTSLSVATYLTAVGADYPVIKSEPSRNGVVVFEFPDPVGEWRVSARQLNLEDTESDVCHVPAARLFAAWKLLREDMNKALGRKR